MNIEEEELRLENEGRIATPQQFRRRSAGERAQSFADNAWMEGQPESAQSSYYTAKTGPAAPARQPSSRLYKATADEAWREYRADSAQYSCKDTTRAPAMPSRRLSGHDYSEFDWSAYGNAGEEFELETFADSSRSSKSQPSCSS